MIKKVYVILFLLLLVIPLASALDFKIDNFKTFDKDVGKYGKIEVWDTGQIGEDTKLTSSVLEFNTDECLINCEATMIPEYFIEGSLIDDIKRSLPLHFAWSWL